MQLGLIGDFRMHTIKGLHLPTDALAAQTARHSEGDRGATGSASSPPASGELTDLPLRTPRPAAEVALPLHAEAMLAFEERVVMQRRLELEGRKYLAETMPRLAPKETTLAGYLFMRAVDGRHVEGGDLTNLHKGNDTVLETREALAYGRGNVTTDIQASNHESTRRVIVGREITAKLEQQHTDFGTPDAAAVAMFVAAGNCGEHAYVATSLHVAKLGEAELAHHVTRKGLDHHWSESRSGKARDDDIVIDAWAEGPAIFAPDGAFTRKEKGLRSVDAFRARESSAVSESIKRTTQQLEAHAPVNLDTRLDELNRQGHRILKKRVWEPEPVLSTSFARRVGKKTGYESIYHRCEIASMGPRPGRFASEGTATDRPTARRNPCGWRGTFSRRQCEDGREGRRGHRRCCERSRAVRQLALLGHQGAPSVVTQRSTRATRARPPGGRGSGRDDHAAGDARTRVAGGLRRVVVGLGVHDHAPSEQAIDAIADADAFHLEAHLRIAGSVGLHRRHVAAVMRCVLRAVRMTAWVEMAASAHPIRCRAIALLVYMEAVFLVRCEAAELHAHADV